MRRQKCRIFMTWENCGHLASRTEVCKAPGQGSLKPIKSGLSWENRDELIGSIYVGDGSMYPGTKAVNKD
jgi:hypothetical protein